MMKCFALLSSKVHLVAQQKGMHNYFAGVLLQARVAACQSNATIDSKY